MYIWSLVSQHKIKSKYINYSFKAWHKYTTSVANALSSRRQKNSQRNDNREATKFQSPEWNTVYDKKESKEVQRDIYMIILWHDGLVSTCRTHDRQGEWPSPRIVQGYGSSLTLPRVHPLWKNFGNDRSWHKAIFCFDACYP